MRDFVDIIYSKSVIEHFYFPEKLVQEIFQYLSQGEALALLAEVTRIFTPSFLRTKSKWVRFSKEIMLLSSAIKPLLVRGIESNE